MSGIAASLRSRVAQEHQAAQAAMRDAVTHAIRAGELLVEAKAAMPHGAFGEFCKSLPFSDRTARGYMRLARLGDGDRQRVADMSLRQALAAIADGPRRTTLAERAEDLVGAIELAYADVCGRIRRDPMDAYPELLPLGEWTRQAWQAVDQVLVEADASGDLATFAFFAQSGADRLCSSFTELRLSSEYATAKVWRDMQADAAIAKTHGGAT